MFSHGASGTNLGHHDSLTALARAGFVAAAFVVGWFADLGWTKDLPRTVIAMIAGEAAIYFFGLLWLAHFVPESKVLDFGLFPFLIGDAIKLAAAAIVVPAGWRLSRNR